MSKAASGPQRTILFYSRITIWLALLFIAGGMAVQSLQVNLFTQSDVDRAFANAMAEQISHALRIRLQDTHRLQQAASNHPQTLQSLREDNPEWRATLRQFLTGASQLRLIHRDDAMGLHNSLGYAVQDLVTRTLNGADLRLEAVQRNGDLQFYWASPIRDEQQRIAGVLLAEYGQAWLSGFQSSASQTLGQVVVTQYVDNDRSRGLEIFRTGKDAPRTGTLVTLPINDFWYLTYVPAEERPQLSLVPLITPWVVVLLATLIGLFILVGLQKRDIKRNQLALLTYVRGLSRRGTDEKPAFTLHLFHELAGNMQHLIHTLRPTTGTSVTSPRDNGRDKPDIVFEPVRKIPVNTHAAAAEQGLPELMVEEMEHEESAPISQGIFRAYDIRGVVGQDLTPEVVYWIGRALGAEVRDRGFSKLALAWDGRLSSPSLSSELQRGVLEAGCHVISLGAQPTGLLYFATYELDTPCGAVITGSHNPAEFNGIKIVIDRHTLAQEELMGLYHRIKRGDLPRGQGELEQRDLSTSYLQRIDDDIQLARPMKIVVDAGNGIAGPLAKQLLERLGVNATCLFCDVDGSFPNHHPDPGVPHNLQTLQQTVLKEQADLGLAFDGDGDRVALVDNQGKIIWPDRLLMLLIEDILPRNPGRDVIYDIKSSRHLATLISRHGGRPAMWKTGHSLMKRKMQETQAVVGGEFSGHLYIQDRWYGFDDGLYAAARLLEILSQRSLSCAEVFAALPEDISTPEITINTDDVRKFSILKSLSEDGQLTEGARVFTMDGLRIEFPDGWGLVRPSNTTPKLTLRFADNNEAAVARLQQRMKEALLRHAPDLNIPF